MRIRGARFFAAALLSVLLSWTGAAGEVKRIAVMVHRPSNRLAWNALARDAAFMLGCDEVLQHYADQAEGLQLTGAARVNGIYSAMKNGLYFPRGESLSEKWAPFLRADVYIEADLSLERLVWRGGTSQKTGMRQVAAPYAHPKACAAALVALVFELAEIPLDPAWQEELKDPETRDPALWFEWAQWIGYQPHWCHHAPWRAPQASAKKILQQDPGFARGGAWALEMLQRKARGQKRSPANPRYLPNAFRVLDSPFYAQTVSFIQTQLTGAKQLREALDGFNLTEMEMHLGMELSETDSTDSVPTAGDPGLDLKGLSASARFRAHLALALSHTKEDVIQKGLAVALAEDREASVRAAAAQGLHRFPAAQVATPLRQALAQDKAPEVRAEVLASLVTLKQLTFAQAKKAASDALPVQLALVRALSHCSFGPGERQTLLSALLQSKHGRARAACLHWLSEDKTRKGDETIVRAAVSQALGSDAEEETLAGLGWILANDAKGFDEQVAPLLKTEAPAVQAAASRVLVRMAPAQTAAIIKQLEGATQPVLQKVLADILAESQGEKQYQETLFALLKRADPGAYAHICLAAYRMLGADRKALARAMRFDPDLNVNLAAVRLVRRLGDKTLAQEVLSWCAAEHPSEYIRARALREMEALNVPGLRPLCCQALFSPFWVVRLEAADILSRVAGSEDAGAIRAAQGNARSEWLRLALEDALCKAEGKPRPLRVRLGLGQREHTEGGDTPNGFQVWLGDFPKSLKRARRLVDEGYRLGVKTVPPNMPGGSVLNACNNSNGARNTMLIEGVLDPLEAWKKKLPYLYYIVLFDEPFTLGTGFHAGRVRAMLLEDGRPDLLHLIRDGLGGKNPGALTPELQAAYAYYNAKFGAEASNWVVHMFRLTAQRKYPDLRLFPQSLSYMRALTHDAFDMIDGDGDYTWQYHYHNFMADGTLGAVNRVLNPGKPLCMVTWMSWYRPNVLNGNTLYIDSAYIKGPWRMRNYMGTRSGLALWATGTEAGFFDSIGLGVTSKKNKGGVVTQNRPSRAFALKPWSKPMEEAIEFLLSDQGFWKETEGKIALELMKEKKSEPTPTGLDAEDDGLGEGDDIELAEEKLTPLQKALKAERTKLHNELMHGISYMNIFNTDATRALSNLPKPDTRRRSTLVIVGRDCGWWYDQGAMIMPALAVVQGFDLVPNYDGVPAADLMQYDTILLRASDEGVTNVLVAKINHWLRHKEKGLLVVGGGCDARKRLFPMLYPEPLAEPFFWDEGVHAKSRSKGKETYKDWRGRERTHVVWPRMKAFRTQAGKALNDPETRLACTYTGAVEPFITTADKEVVLARWKAPAEVRSIVLFDGADSAGPVYTEALETAILAADRERGAKVTRNRWWGHTLYENDRFVVDVASSGYKTLHQARPRQHRGVDIITGVINPAVRHGECALVLKDYVGPYAGAKGDWAVMARNALKGMELLAPTRIKIHAQGVTRVSHIGTAPIRLAETRGFDKVEDQVWVWKKMREGKKAYSLNDVEGGKELHFVSPEPVEVIVGE